MGTTAAFGKSPSGGAVQVWVTPSPTGNGGKVLITGAVADYGTGQTVNSSGKPDGNGNYKNLLLKKGTILVNSKKFNAAQNNANPPINKSNCSAVVKVSEPITFVSGTGAYGGISGTVNLTSRYAVILPKTSSGSCNASNSAQPLAQFGVVTGSGNVSF